MVKTEEQKEKEAEETWAKISKRRGLELAQHNKDFYGYTVFTINFNGVPIRLVTEKDALKVIENLFKSEEGKARHSSQA